jgi:hypothetical protein
MGEYNDNPLNAPDMAELSPVVMDYSDTPLTDWKNEPTVRDLKQDYTDASAAHQSHVMDVNTWLDNLNITGSAKPVKKRGRSAVQPMLIRKQAEWRYAALSEPFLSTPDVFNVDPVTFEDGPAAKQNELVLNHQWNNQINKVAFIDEYVRTAVDEGTVIVRVGWDFEEEEQEVMVPDMQVQPIQDPAMLQQLREVMLLLQQGGPAEQVPPQLLQAAQLSAQAGRPVHLVQVGMKPEMQMVTLKNQPVYDICNYNNVMIDPTCMGDLKKANFIIYSFETSLSELEKDGKYSNLDKINIESNSILGTPDYESDDASSFNFTDEPRKKFIAYEYWGFWDIDNTGKTKPFVATWVGDVMIRMERNPFPDNALPFVKIQYLPKRRSNYGEPDGKLLEDNQKIIGAVSRGMIDIMGRSANGQTGMRKDMLDITNKRKFDRGEDYEFNATVDPKQGVYTHTYTEIPKSAEFMVNMQNAEAESLTGVKAFSQGITGQALGSTATGIRSALDATSKRELGILRRLADGIKEIGYKTISMNGVFLDDQEVVRVTNEEFITINKEDLAGRFDLRLSISTAEADNEKAQELSFMLQTMGNNMPPEMSQMVLAEIAELRKMPELAKQIKSYQPKPDPAQQKKVELELALLEAQVRKENAAAIENEAQAKLDLARAETELARARNLDTQSDKNNLDFVEQETGLKREHEKQMSAANTKGKIVADTINTVVKQKAAEANSRPPSGTAGQQSMSSL